MMRKTLLAYCFGVLFLASCKNDDPGIGISGNMYDTYQPVSKGSFWKYVKTDVMVSGSQTETQTITGSKDIINKKTYYTLRTQTATTDDTLSHVSHEGGNYTIRTKLSTGGFSIEHLYLQDNPVVGKNWIANTSDNGLVNGVPARILGTVAEKEISKTVSGKKFNNVIHTILQLQFDQGSGYTTVNVIDYYIAKSVGIIEIDYSDGTTITSTKKITDYDIK